MIILTTLTAPLIHFCLKGWENVIFELGSERVKAKCTDDYRRGGQHLLYRRLEGYADQ